MMSTRSRVRVGQPPRLPPTGQESGGFAHGLALVTVLAALVCLAQGDVVLALLLTVPAIALLIPDR